MEGQGSEGVQQAIGCRRSGRLTDQILRGPGVGDKPGKWACLTFEGQAYASWCGAPRFFVAEDNPERWDALRALARIGGAGRGWGGRSRRQPPLDAFRTRARGAGPAGAPRRRWRGPAFPCSSRRWRGRAGWRARAASRAGRTGGLAGGGRIPRGVVSRHRRTGARPWPRRGAARARPGTPRRPPGCGSRRVAVPRGPRGRAARGLASGGLSEGRGA